MPRGGAECICLWGKRGCTETPLRGMVPLVMLLHWPGRRWRQTGRRQVAAAAVAAMAASAAPVVVAMPAAAGAAIAAGRRAPTAAA